MGVVTQPPPAPDPPPLWGCGLIAFTPIILASTPCSPDPPPCRNFIFTLSSSFQNFLLSLTQPSVNRWLQSTYLGQARAGGELDTHVDILTLISPHPPNLLCPLITFRGVSLQTFLCACTYICIFLIQKCDQGLSYSSLAKVLEYLMQL